MVSMSTQTYSMRPLIPESLEKRAEDVVDIGGYSNVGELVRDATRRRIEELEGNSE